MTSPRWLLALTVAWIAVAPSLAVGQTPDPPEPIAPAVPDNWDVVESAVRTELAQRWHTDPGHLVLDWGPHSNVGSIDPTVPVELVGSGSGGSWVVRIAAERGTVGIRMRAGTRRTVRVAAGPMRRGHVLTPSDVTIEERTEWGPPLEGSGPIAEAGWVVERGIAAGDRLTAPAVRPAPVVRTGEPVEVAWSSGIIRLTVPGRALGTARPGESVRVRLETGKRLTGVATHDGRIAVDAFPTQESP